jgi:hypothetical protein
MAKGRKDRPSGERTAVTVGIVGGGIAGLYCAHHLLQVGGYSVTLYECLDRLGGRIETCRNLGGRRGFTAECGPMRFEPEIQPLFEHLCRELDIELVPFPPPSSERVKEKCYPDLAPDELRNGKPLPTDELLKLGVFRMFGEDPRTTAGRHWLKTLDLVPGHRPRDWKHPLEGFLEHTADELRATTTVHRPSRIEGADWWELGFWNALSQTLTHQAILRIRDTGTFYHLIPDNPNAVEWAIFWLRLHQLRLFQHTSGGDLSTIPTGVQTIVEAIEKQFERRDFEPKLSHQVTAVLPGSTPGRVKLKVVDTISKPPREIGDREFDHVILALPRSPLLKLSDNFPEDVQARLDWVIGFPLLKAFLVVDDPWWKRKGPPKNASPTVKRLVTTGKLPVMSHRNAGNVPTRELHYFLRTDTKPIAGMVMLYTDHPATEFWKALVPKGIRNMHTSAAVCGAGTDRVRLKEALVRYLGFEKQERQGLSAGSLVQRPVDEHRVWDSVTAYAIRDWSCEPFGAGCHAWKPGVQSSLARDRLPAFALDRTDGSTKNVHICGEAYSDYQGFIEGALQTAMDVLERICGRCPVCDP